MIRSALLSLSLALFAFPAAAQIYKWVDEKGVSHFSETPPSDGKATKVEVKPAAGSESTKAATDWKQRESEAREQRIQKQQKEHDGEAKAQADAASRHRLCLEAQRRLDILRTSQRVYDMNEKGERVYLDDDQREREIAAWQAKANRSCD